MTTPKAETLRRAAALIRERAEAATPGPWGHFKHAVHEGIEQTGGDIASTWPDPYAQNSEHIASWHPVVAGAVADWLEVTARDVGTSSTAYHAAHDVARAYLGESNA